MTLLIIIVVAIVFFASITPNKKTQGEIYQAKNSLPNIYLQSRGMGGLVRTLNLAFDDSSILEYFAYENGIVTLKMKNGSTLKAPLAQMEVTYSTYVSVIKMTITAYGRTLDVIAFDNYNDHEWNVIIRIMALAGKTYCTYNLTINVDNTQGNIQQILNELRYIG